MNEDRSVCVGLDTHSATIASGGELWRMKAIEADATPRRVTAAIRREWMPVESVNATAIGTDDEGEILITDVARELYHLQLPEDAGVGIG